MNTAYSVEYLIGLVHELCHSNGEQEWVEFKRDNANPQEIGEYISALANAAALNGKMHAYLLWGIANSSHEIVGTSFDPTSARKGNEPLQSWLLRLLSPKIAYRFYKVPFDNKNVVLLEISRASDQPVRFKNIEYIRIGEVKKPLKEAPNLQRELWRVFDRTPFEALVARERESSELVLQLLDYPGFFDLLQLPLPANRRQILESLKENDLIRKCPAGGWDITNLGAILLAKNLAKFSGLQYKLIRVIHYRGSGRIAAANEVSMSKGYASGFEDLVNYIDGLLSRNEIMEQALRKVVPMYPKLAVRELVANALIHQDLSMTGACPMVEIFEDRIEITNPGAPLVSTSRFVDTSPRSRNEAIASLMRCFGICEQRGSGIDQVVNQVELFQLPAPLFEVPGDFTRAVLFAHKKLKEMSKRDRIRACYLHACLCYVTRRKITNATLRERLGVSRQNAAEVSRLLKDALDNNAIAIEDVSVGTRSRAYLPYWAVADGDGSAKFV